MGCIGVVKPGFADAQTLRRGCIRVGVRVFWALDACFGARGVVCGVVEALAQEGVLPLPVSCFLRPEPNDEKLKNHVKPMCSQQRHKRQSRQSKLTLNIQQKHRTKKNRQKNRNENI